MSTITPDEVDAILDRVRRWPSPSRIELARRILESLDPPTLAEPGPPPSVRALRGVSADRAAGLLRTDRPAPTDVECRRIIEEEVWQKSGS